MNYKTIQRLIVALNLLVIFSSCQKNKSIDDPEKLKNVLLAYFDGIENKDFKKMEESTTDDFVLYEMGRVWNNDSVFKQMKAFPYRAEYTLDSFKINIDHISGHITYYNHGVFVFDDTIKQDFDWIESAAFRKNNLGWKMYFLHITERYAPEKADVSQNVISAASASKKTD
jgi:hypothetical protein